MSEARDRIYDNPDVSVKETDTGFDVSFRYMTPAKAKLANFLFQIIQVPIYFFFVLDVGLAYAWAAGDARTVILPDLRFLSGVYDIYSYLGQIVADLFFGFVVDAPARSRFADGLTLVGSGFAVALLVPGVFTALERRDFAPRILSLLFASRIRVSISPNKVRFSRKEFHYDSDDGFISEPTKATQNNTGRGREDDQSREIVFVRGGVKFIPVATVYGIHKARNITIALARLHNDIRSGP